MKQNSLACSGFEGVNGRACQRGWLLDVIKLVVPWPQLAVLIQPFVPLIESKRGRFAGTHHADFETASAQDWYGSRRLFDGAPGFHPKPRLSAAREMHKANMTFQGNQGLKMNPITHKSKAYRLVSIPCILLFGLGSALAQSHFSTPSSISTPESIEIDAYLQNYYAGVVAAKTTSSHLFKESSCVDISHQPAFSNPLLKDHQIQLQPSPQLRKILPNIAEDTTPSPCPKGSVEMKLPTREQITQAGSLSKFLAKHPDASKLAGKFGNTPTPSVNGHEYAVYGQYVNATAAQSTFNIWKPAVQYGDMSLSQLWLAGGSGNFLQTAEVGSQVLPSKYGDTSPHLFIFYTSDGYSHPGTLASGCYNLDCGAFIQTSNILSIGGILPSSSSGGAQVEGTVAFFRDPGTGNWILFYFNGSSYIQSGYYPRALYRSGQMSQFAQFVEFGGEIYTPSSFPHTSTDMGSGQFPTAGYGYAAYQRNLAYMDTNSTTHNFQYSWKSVDNANCYNIINGPQGSWGTSIYFGGSGYSAICP